MQRHFAADQPLRILEIICPFDSMGPLLLLLLTCSIFISRSSYLSRQRPSPLPLLFDLKLLLDDS